MKTPYSNNLLSPFLPLSLAITGNISQQKIITFRAMFHMKPNFNLSIKRGIGALYELRAPSATPHS